MPRTAVLLGVLTVLLACGAVYGGFHYATDAVFGAILGTIALFLAPHLFRRFGGTWELPRDARA